MSYAVARPEIAEVLDLETGEYLSAADVIGDDYDKVEHLRLELSTAVKTRTPRYACPMCGVQVYLVCSPAGRRFFFRHVNEQVGCPAVTRGELTREEIDARKYNGAKESHRHQQMKAWVAQCLEADGRFTDVRLEQRMTGALTGEYRKPDVRAKLGDLDVVFEIQLSTTYLHVIAARRHFYLENGALLVWIFADFPVTDRALTLDDVFFNNNQNAFVVNAKTVAASLAARELKLGCIWADASSSEQNFVLNRKLVSFHELTLDQPRQQVYYYDYYGERAKLEAERAQDAAEIQRKAELERAQRQLMLDRKAMESAPECVSARKEFETLWLRYDEAGSPEMVERWEALRYEFEEAFQFGLPQYMGKMPRQLLDTLYTVKLGRVIGWRYENLVEVAHWVETKYPQYFQLFLRTLHRYGRYEAVLAQDKNGKWSRKLKAYREGSGEAKARYRHESKHDALIVCLFPELTRS